MFEKKKTGNLKYTHITLSSVTFVDESSSNRDLTCIRRQD